MKKETEAGFLKAVIAFANLRGYKVAHFRPGRVADKGGGQTWRTAVSGQGKGFPDLVMVNPVKEHMVVAELKVGRGKTSPDQNEWLEHFERVCDDVYVWRPSDWPLIEKVLS